MNLTPGIQKKFKRIVVKKANSRDFTHHKWFVKYHLEIVEQMSMELCEIYKNANKDLVYTLVWLHDLGKIIDRSNELQTTINKGKKYLRDLGFDKNYINKVLKYYEIFERKNTEDLNKAPIEVKIVSSADAASHFVGPFFYLWWYENPNTNFEMLMEDNLKKARKDWERKMVIKEVRARFKERFYTTIEQNGEIPKKYFI